MAQQQFTYSINANITPLEAFEKISEVSKWWISGVERNTHHLNDVFTVRLGTTWKTFEIIESIPGKLLIWLVKDCNLPWNDSLNEWTGTRIIWNIIPTVQNSVQIVFTHLGLVELNCGEQCMASWTNYIKTSLFKYITEGKGMPDNF